MACPTQGILGSTLTFTVRALNTDGEPIDFSSSPPIFTIYSDLETGTIVPGFQDIEMYPSDIAEGFYYKEITLDENLFEEYKSYVISIYAEIEGYGVYKTYIFTVVSEETYNVLTQAEELGDINASVSARDSFAQGKYGIFMLMLTDARSNPIDVDIMSFSIIKGSEEILSDASSPLQVGDGKYVYEWRIPATQELGLYTAIWEYEIHGVTYDVIQMFTVNASSTQSDSSLFYNNRLIDIRAAFESLIQCAQAIPVYYEQASPSRDRRKFEFTFKNWNQSSMVKIYRNNNIVTDNFQINYYKGTVTFYDTLLEEDVIHADYNFRWFSDREIDTFLTNALNAFNSFPPFTNNSLARLPDAYVPAVLYGAARDALRHLLMCLNFQNPQQIFGGKEEAANAKTSIESLKNNYEEDWNKLADIKKRGSYPIMGVAAQPLMSLPGGRSRWFAYLFS